MLEPTSPNLSASYFGPFLIVLAKTGLPVDFFLPGDSLLIAAGSTLSLPHWIKLIF